MGRRNLRPCRHCCARLGTRPRGLCRQCYFDLARRELHARKSPAADDFHGEAPLPDEPTDALPGSPEKMQILIGRAALRQQLHHPDDRKLPGGLGTLTRRKPERPAVAEQIAMYLWLAFWVLLAVAFACGGRVYRAGRWLYRKAARR